MTLPSPQRLAVEPLKNMGDQLIASAASEKIATGQPLLVRGCFSLSPALSAELGATPHRALLITTVLGLAGACHAGFPFLEASLFPDDLQLEPHATTGWFTLDAAALSGLGMRGVYYISCSLGTLIAPPIRIQVL